MVLNATFNTNAVISWRSVLLVEETGVSAENHRPTVSQWQTLSHIVVSRLCGIRTHNISGDMHWLHRYHMITTTTALEDGLMVLNATFNNIYWRSVLLGEETGGPGKIHRPVASHWQTLPHNVVHLALIEIRTRNARDRKFKKIMINYNA